MSAYDRPPIKGLSPRAWLALTGVALVLVAARSSLNEIEWRLDYSRALEAAHSRNVPVLVDFYADWCGPCHELDIDVFSLDDVAAVIQRDYIPLRVDLSNTAVRTPEREIADRFNVKGIPSVLILDPYDEVVIGRASPSDLTPNGMLAFLNRHAPSHE